MAILLGRNLESIVIVPCARVHLQASACFFSLVLDSGEEAMRKIECFRVGRLEGLVHDIFGLFVTKSQASAS